MIVLRLARGLDTPVLGYIRMFKIKYGSNFAQEAVLAFGPLLFFYIKSGYFNAMRSALTFPYIYCLIFFMLYQGIYSDISNNQAK